MLVPIMTEKTAPTYQELVNVLDSTSLKMHPAQVHGLVCGIIIGNDDPDAAWKEIVTGKKHGQSHEVLQQLYAANKRQLHDFLFEFQLLLPDDEIDLPIRAEALTLWCQGFLTGLKLTGVAIADRKPGEVTEAINDLIEIAKMNYEEVVASDEDESAYIELVEYIRMAVILIYQDVKENAGKNPIEQTNLH